MASTSYRCYGPNLKPLWCSQHHIDVMSPASYRRTRMRIFKQCQSWMYTRRCFNDWRLSKTLQLFVHAGHLSWTIADSVHKANTLTWQIKPLRWLENQHAIHHCFVLTNDLSWAMHNIIEMVRSDHFSLHLIRFFCAACTHVFYSTSDASEKSISHTVFQSISEEYVKGSLFEKVLQKKKFRERTSKGFSQKECFRKSRPEGNEKEVTERVCQEECLVQSN